MSKPMVRARLYFADGRTIVRDISIGARVVHLDVAPIAFTVTDEIDADGCVICREDVEDAADAS